MAKKIHQVIAYKDGKECANLLYPSEKAWKVAITEFTAMGCEVEKGITVLTADGTPASYLQPNHVLKI